LFILYYIINKHLRKEKKWLCFFILKSSNKNSPVICLLYTVHSKGIKTLIFLSKQKQINKHRWLYSLWTVHVPKKCKSCSCHLLYFKANAEWQISACFFPCCDTVLMEALNSFRHLYIFSYKSRISVCRFNTTAVHDKWWCILFLYQKMSFEEQLWGTHSGRFYLIAPHRRRSLENTSVPPSTSKSQVIHFTFCLFY